MKLHVITICHMEPEIVAWSLMRYHRTTHIVPDSWTLLDNCWPIRWSNSFLGLKKIANLVPNGLLQTTPVNLGGHGGFNAVLNTLKIQPDDFVLGYDPDSNPVYQGWLEAMLSVMKADPTLGYVSLLDNRNTDRKWTYETIDGYKVAFIDHPEMWNVTLFRGAAVAQGMLSDASKWGATFYGHVETAMFKYVRELGMRNGYMFDYREDKCPLEHPVAYTNWKQAHAYGKYPGNFDAYCKERGIL